MITSRHRVRGASGLLLSVAAPVLALAALALAMGQPALANSASHTHSRHPLAASPAPSFHATASAHAGRRHGAASAHATASAHTTTHSTHSSTRTAAVHAGYGASSHHGRLLQADSRANSRAGTRHGRPLRGQAMEAAVPAGRRHRGIEPLMVAEVDGRDGDGGYTAHLHGRHGAPTQSGRAPYREGAAVMVASAPVYSRRRSAAEIAAPNPARPYAEGVSEPDDASDSPAPAGVAAAGLAPTTAVVLAASAVPSRPNGTNSAPTRVVSGFGDEVALASPDPGTTRRRSHPQPGNALPGYMPAPPPVNLAERNAITMVAISPAVLPDIYDHSGRLISVAPLKGSHEVLVHQNAMATADGLNRIQDEAELNRMRASRELVDFPETSGLEMNPQLPYDRRCARPWTVLFAVDIAHNYYQRFHQPLYVTSAVRTVSFQERLQRINGNAAAVDGDAASPHLTGQALDFGKHGMNAAELAWMRSYLLPLMESGRIDVEEEFQQACFHISVYRRYAATRGTGQVMAQMQTGTVAPQP